MRLVETTLLVLLASAFPLTLNLGCQQGKGEAVEPSSSREAGAVKAAETWLLFVDAEKYPESWDTAASMFQAAVPKTQWADQIKGARAPLGKLVKRTLESRTYAKQAIETITPMKDDDGTWKVSGYFIK